MATVRNSRAAQEQRLAPKVEGGERGHRRTSFLSEAGTILLSSALDLRETCGRAADLVIRRVAEGCVVEVCGEAPVVAHADPSKADAVRALYDVGSEDARLLFTDCIDTTALLLRNVDTEALSRLVGDGRAAALAALGMRTLLVVPLRARGSTIGAVAAWTGEGHGTYETADRAMMERFAQKASLAIENARLYRAERQARARLERAAMRARRTQSFAAEVASALSTDDVGRAIVTHGVGAVDAITGGVWLLEPGAETARVLRTEGFPEDAAQRFAVLPMSMPLPVTDAIRTAEPVIVESRAEYEARYPVSAERLRGVSGFDTFAVAVLPLVVGHAAIGALTLTWRDEHALEDDERAFLRVIAGHGAQALARAQLYEAERKARAEVALLYRLVDAAGQAMTLEDVYELALDVVERALGVERAALLLFDGNGVMRFKAWRGISDAYREAVEGHSPWSIGAREPEMLEVPDVRQDESLAAYRQLFADEQILALTFVPLVHKRQLLGKLMIYSNAPRQLQADEIRMIRSIATEVAHAIARKLGDAEIVRLYAEAQAARSAAEEANRMKDEFLGVVSHEARTPLSAILGWAGILQSNVDVTPEIRTRGIAVIERNARAQLKIIEDILDVARIMSGKLVIDPRPTAFNQVISEAIDAVRPSAGAKNIRLMFESSDESDTIMCDPERARQIVWNLLSNAIKFTPRGGSVSVRLRREAAAISLEVQDTGPGISPEFLPYVFERFRQADSSTKRAQGGLGLGLAIVRHLVELHGGQVGADSAGVGKGAVFTVTLPARNDTNAAQSANAAAQSEPAQVERVEETDLRGRRVLIVDDNMDTREMLEHVLQQRGAEVRTAASAADALAQVSAFGPQVMISDIGMPQEDGYHLIRRVRELPPPLGDLRAIAFTAYARPTDRARALEAGYDEHVAKPLNLATLAQLIVEVTQRTSPPLAGG